ncbi:cupin domain-containing protein [Aneurinibacillus uraniidurans]|uniref:cupin domain-containing protein n=1 Tax=Aneurinibacillus uraniidurans TaxID=2966586 RepID=UPI0023493024|nr:cupin domain-containing protein [Aneurinibacillus sp. B1]WCN37463.1 cupin domain-containing protein [Aneurinibacillus sp. B1]
MNIGENIRSLRNRKRITIAEMCEGTGLSKGFVSQVENGKTSPSIATLQTIADFLHVPLAYLLLEPSQAVKVVRREERVVHEFGKNGIRVELLTPQNRDGLRMMITYTPPGVGTGDEPHAHKGEEAHLVLEGTFLIQQGEDEFVVGPGDSFYWKACIPHRVVNIGDTMGKMLISVYAAHSDDMI